MTYTYDPDGNYNQPDTEGNRFVNQTSPWKPQQRVGLIQAVQLVKAVLLNDE